MTPDHAHILRILYNLLPPCVICWWHQAVAGFRLSNKIALQITETLTFFMRNNPTIKDIAKHAGVGTTTVSRARNYSQQQLDTTAALTNASCKTSSASILSFRTVTASDNAWSLYFSTNNLKAPWSSFLIFSINNLSCSSLVNAFLDQMFLIQSTNCMTYQSLARMRFLINQNPP